MNDHQYEDDIKVQALWGNPEHGNLQKCWIADYGPVQGSRYIKIGGRFPLVCVDIDDLWKVSV